MRQKEQRIVESLYNTDRTEVFRVLREFADEIERLAGGGRGGLDLRKAAEDCVYRVGNSCVAETCSIHPCVARCMAYRPHEPMRVVGGDLPWAKQAAKAEGER